MRQTNIIQLVIRLKLNSKKEKMLNKFQKYAGVATTTAAALMISARGVIANEGIGTITVPEEGYAKDVGTLIGAILSFVMVIAALLLLLYMIWGGIE